MERQAAKVQPWNGHEYRCVQPCLTPVPSVLHPDAGPTTAEATDIYPCTTRTSTEAAFTTFTAALQTDIYTAICTGTTADPGPGSTAKHAVTAAHVGDVSTAAANSTSAIATNKNTSAHTPEAAAHTPAAAAHTPVAASSTNCPKFRAAGHATR